MSMMTSAVFCGRRSPSYGQGYGSDSMWRTGIFLQVLGRAGVEALGLREAAGGAVGDDHFALPRQLVASGHHVVHVGVGTVARAALHGDIAAMAELVDVVLDRPVLAGFPHQVRPHFAGDDLVG